MSVPWFRGPMTPFDTESTGLDVENDRIVTATVVVMRPDPGGGRHNLDIRSHLIAVDVDIPDAAKAVHGIDTAYAREHGKPAADVLDLVAADIALSLRAQVPVVGMNLPYDFTLLDRECRRWNVPTVTDRLDGAPFAPVVDVYTIDKALDRYRKGSRKLVDLCAHYDAVIDGAHDATHDALAAARVAFRIGQRSQMDADRLRAIYRDRRYPSEMARAFQNLGRMSLAELHAAQVGWYLQQSEGLRDYWMRQAEELRNRIANAEGDEARAIAEQELAELEAKVDGIRTEWPIAPLTKGTSQ